MAECKNQKQSEIYEFLKKYTEEKGYPPSVREICEAVSLRSTSTVHGHLKRLEKKGLIKRDPTKPRALEILELNHGNKEFIHIPVIGRVTAGMPVLAFENIEDTFALPANFVKHDRELFMLKVMGESMIEAGIQDGDFAIIEKASSANNGEIVVALIDNEATIKRFFKESDHIRLQPENSTMSPIIVDTCSILGKLVAIYRKY
ncbi:MULTISPECIES: transcriptional repressor LexA [Clostridium]|uniref:LexA repressor n=1 Tax=Clostridium cadaveris TaxID=1529 RepID=A0A1I2J9M1_9CLOT|nr:transcriptional repressor LexA [Clostridium cadaveris]MDU4952469.1 transcriptional repressor LexA [Clostridium sp.]MDM8312547.1 transcriptional repressor LexA [Clostridium cadaveris]MDY4948360.1 transcriptional repressor LexA [Clostridium cadaveris]NME64100.1 transcriptional repressor LexA [Clostridium cadaveris]NWK10343.1 transcriptional repressor LexA [Clostridium cadaveris]